MKRLFFTLIFLFFVYFSLQAFFYFFGPGHTVNYVINDFKIKEEYINNQSKEMQSYNFVVSKDNNDFYFQIFNDFGNKEKIIQDIKFYDKNNMLCIMPIFIEDKAFTDLMCLRDNVVYNYADLENSNVEIDEFYNSLDKYKTKENLNNQDSRNNITLYKNNLQPNYYLSFVTYKGFIYANPTNKVLTPKNIFTSDVYDNYLSAYVNEYYVTVNYDEQYGYTRIYLYDITNGKSEELKVPNNIEKNSYIEGTYKNSLYIFDRSNKKQYEVDTSAKNVLEVGNTSTGVKILRNGTFERVSAYECANKDILFEYVPTSTDNYHYIGTTGGKKTGYSYYYQQINDSYRIYRTNNNYQKQYTYLFKTKYIDKLIIINNYIYFLDDNYIKYYSDLTGVRNLVYNSELYFNQNIEYQIIYRK